MAEITKVTQLTRNPYVNLYELDTVNRKQRPGHYYVASRARETDELELRTRTQKPDGVIIYSLYGEKQDRVVLVRQYRYTIDDYIYEFPAGLVEPGEDYHDAAVREMKEETGLTLHPIPVDNFLAKPYYTTIGMTDECCATVYGYADGEVSQSGLEDTEEIEVVLADRTHDRHALLLQNALNLCAVGEHDRTEVQRILKEERVAIMCAYMLMHFLHDEEPFAFLL